MHAQSEEKTGIANVKSSIMVFFSNQAPTGASHYVMLSIRFPIGMRCAQNPRGCSEHMYLCLHAIRSFLMFLTVRIRLTAALTAQRMNAYEAADRTGSSHV